MEFTDFTIGLEFISYNKRWRCTDIGTRVVVAISLEPHDIVSSEPDPANPSKHIKRHFQSADPVWLEGPPYAIVEHVFDEYSLESCKPSNRPHP